MSGAAPQQPCPADLLAQRRGWPLERVLFAMAGTMTLVGALLSALVSPWFLLLVAFVGVNQWLLVAFGDCPASLFLTHALHCSAPRRAALSGFPAPCSVLSPDASPSGAPQAD